MPPPGADPPIVSDKPNIVGDFDVVVIGAGLAGATSAGLLSKAGHTVYLVDKATFPRAKVCGCCLNGSAVSSLQRIGLGHLLVELGAVPLSAVTIGHAGRSARLNLPAGTALSRERLDYELLQWAIAQGVVFDSPFSAELGPADAKRRSVVIRNRQGRPAGEVRGRVVLVASGLHGLKPQVADYTAEVRVGSRIGAGTVLPESVPGYEAGTIFMAVGPSGYVGLVRLEDDRLDVAAAFDAEFVRASGGLASAATRVLDSAGFPPLPELTVASWQGTPRLTRTAKQIGGERWLAIGDAAGYVEPFTGEGMAWALASAEAVAPLVETTLGNDQWQADWVAEWQRHYRRAVTDRQLICRLMAGTLRRPFLTRGLVTLLRHCPTIARPFLARMNSPAGSKTSRTPVRNLAEPTKL